MTNYVILKCHFNKTVHVLDVRLTTFHALGALKMPFGALPVHNLCSSTGGDSYLANIEKFIISYYLADFKAFIQIVEKNKVVFCAYIL